MIDIAEDWVAYEHDEANNKISGILQISFNENIIEKNNLKTASISNLKVAIFKYFKKEFPTLKASLSAKILDSKLTFSNIEEGKATLKYSIDGAF